MSGPATDGIIGAEARSGLGVAEVLDDDLLRLAHWEEADAGLVCGITTAASGDFGVSEGTGGGLLDAYGGLARRLGFGRVSVPLQVHGTEVITLNHNDLEGSPGGVAVVLAGRVDGQVTTARGTLLASTAADCVPVYAWHPGSGALGLSHAGWKGVAGGILARTIDRLAAEPAEIRVHLGPAICGACYEVDRPVLTALGREGDRARVDLRGVLVDQALELGIPRAGLTASRLCTRCGEAGLHSHRGSGGEAGRMAAFLGIRGEGPRV